MEEEKKNVEIYSQLDDKDIEIYTNLVADYISNDVTPSKKRFGCQSRIFSTPDFKIRNEIDLRENMKDYISYQKSKLSAFKRNEDKSIKTDKSLDSDTRKEFLETLGKIVRTTNKKLDTASRKFASDIDKYKAQLDDSTSNVAIDDINFAEEDIKNKHEINTRVWDEFLYIMNCADISKIKILARLTIKNYAPLVEKTFKHLDVIRKLGIEDSEYENLSKEFIRILNTHIQEENEL